MVLFEKLNPILNNQGGLSMATFENLDRLLQRFAAKTVPGCACVIMRNGETI